MHVAARGGRRNGARTDVYARTYARTHHVDVMAIQLHSVGDEAVDGGRDDLAVGLGVVVTVVAHLGVAEIVHEHEPARTRARDGRPRNGGVVALRVRDAPASARARWPARTPTVRTLQHARPHDARTHDSMHTCTYERTQCSAGWSEASWLSAQCAAGCFPAWVGGAIAP